ncbi:hypothetical protein FGO68_gene16772 [Halteria grandinella]|uniref:Uncharacterized protein n=1 Tax=Halteria grandinella TaxID=5974 RepID=A0A8J8TAF8_HALGN|nr:hypothetical protein FGO68_gene16772 [Halteria grandinella]
MNIALKNHHCKGSVSLLQLGTYNRQGREGRLQLQWHRDRYPERSIEAPGLDLCKQCQLDKQCKHPLQVQSKFPCHRSKVWHLSLCSTFRQGRVCRQQHQPLNTHWGQLHCKQLGHLLQLGILSLQDTWYILYLLKERICQWCMQLVWQRLRRKSSLLGKLSKLWRGLGNTIQQVCHRKQSYLSQLKGTYTQLGSLCKCRLLIMNIVRHCRLQDPRFWLDRHIPRGKWCKQLHLQGNMKCLGRPPGQRLYLHSNILLSKMCKSCFLQLRSSRWRRGSDLSRYWGRSTRRGIGNKQWYHLGNIGLFLSQYRLQVRLRLKRIWSQLGIWCKLHLPIGHSSQQYMQLVSQKLRHMIFLLGIGSKLLNQLESIAQGLCQSMLWVNQSLLGTLSQLDIECILLHLIVNSSHQHKRSQSLHQGMRILHHNSSKQLTLQQRTALQVQGYKGLVHLQLSGICTRLGIECIHHLLIVRSIQVCKLQGLHFSRGMKSQQGRCCKLSHQQVSTDLAQCLSKQLQLRLLGSKNLLGKSCRVRLQAEHSTQYRTVRDHPEQKGIRSRQDIWSKKSSQRMRTTLNLCLSMPLGMLLQLHIQNQLGIECTPLLQGARNIQNRTAQEQNLRRSKLCQPGRSSMQWILLMSIILQKLHYMPQGLMKLKDTWNLQDIWCKPHRSLVHSNLSCMQQVCLYLWGTVSRQGKDSIKLSRQGNTAR